MENHDPEPKWEWQAGDEGLHFEIPHGEGIPLPPSTKIQGGFDSWQSKNQPCSVSGLSGKSIKEVERDLGDHFTSVRQLNCYMDSWGVLKGKSVHRLNPMELSRRVCKYGPRV